MSYQTALCARVIKSGDIASVLNFGITPEDFTESEAKSFWNVILSYYSQQGMPGSVISPAMMQMHFPTLVWEDDMPGMKIENLCAQVRKNRVRIEANAAMTKCIARIDSPLVDITEDLQELHHTISSIIALGSKGNTDVNLKTGWGNVLRDMGLARTGTVRAVAPWPWDALNVATCGGIKKDDYVVLYGRPKSMKTWVLIAVLAHLFQHQKKVLVYTKEMSPDNVYARTIATICGMKYDDLREATATGRPLSFDDEKLLYDYWECISNDPEWSDRLVVLSGRDAPAGGDTVAWLSSKIDQYRPDVMLVDGMYLLSDQKKSTVDHHRVMNISRDLRQMVFSTGVPVVATMQANRKAAGHTEANLDEIAYSDGVAQDATIAARVINDKSSPTISLVIGGSREFKLHGIRIFGKPAEDFSFHSILDEKDIEKAREADVGEAEEKAAKAIKKTKREPKVEGTTVAEAMQDAAVRIR
jgi:replicative DNA helicase